MKTKRCEVDTEGQRAIAQLGVPMIAFESRVELKRDEFKLKDDDI